MKIRVSTLVVDGRPYVVDPEGRVCIEGVYYLVQVTLQIAQVQL